MYLERKELRTSQKGKKAKSWDEIKEVLTEKQEKGEIYYHKSFSDLATITIRSHYCRLNQKYSKIEVDKLKLIDKIKP